MHCIFTHIIYSQNSNSSILYLCLFENNRAILSQLCLCFYCQFVLLCTLILKLLFFLNLFICGFPLCNYLHYYRLFFAYFVYLKIIYLFPVNVVILYIYVNYLCFIQTIHINFHKTNIILKRKGNLYEKFFSYLINLCCCA